MKPYMGQSVVYREPRIPQIGSPFPYLTASCRQLRADHVRKGVPGGEIFRRLDLRGQATGEN